MYWKFTMINYKFIKAQIISPVQCYGTLKRNLDNITRRWINFFWKDIRLNLFSKSIRRSTHRMTSRNFRTFDLESFPKRLATKRWKTSTSVWRIRQFTSATSEDDTSMHPPRIPYAPSIFMGPSTCCQTYWALANGRGHARNSWIFKQVTKQSSFALAPAPGTDTPSGHQAVPYYLIAYWAEMELSYSVQ